MLVLVVVVPQKYWNVPTVVRLLVNQINAVDVVAVRSPSNMNLFWQGDEVV